MKTKSMQTLFTPPIVAPSSCDMVAICISPCRAPQFASIRTLLSTVIVQVSPKLERKLTPLSRFCTTCSTNDNTTDYSNKLSRVG